MTTPVYGQDASLLRLPLDIDRRASVETVSRFRRLLEPAKRDPRRAAFGALGSYVGPVAGFRYMIECNMRSDPKSVIVHDNAAGAWGRVYEVWIVRRGDGSLKTIANWKDSGQPWISERDPKRLEAIEEDVLDRAITNAIDLECAKRGIAPDREQSIEIYEKALEDVRDMDMTPNEAARFRVSRWVEEYETGRV